MNEQDREAYSRVAELEDFLLERGFVKCDISACNCGSWHHRYGLAERWREIKDAMAEAGHPLTNENGNLLLTAVQALIKQRNDLERENAELRKVLIESNRIITDAQNILAKYIVPDDNDSEKAIDALLGLLDGSRWRELREQSKAAMTQEKMG